MAVDNRRKQSVPPWRKWYADYLDTGELSEEFVRGLTKMFRWVSRNYSHALAGPVWMSRDAFQTGHYAGSKLEDAAQEILMLMVQHIRQSVSIREHHEQGMSDAEFDHYLSAVMENDCLRVCRQLTPLWWDIRDRLQDLETLAMIEKRSSLYVPAAWLKSSIPPSLDLEELRCRAHSVPLYPGKMGSHLSEKQLQRVVDQIFEQVEAPIPLNELTTIVLSVFHAKPEDLVSIDQIGEGGDGLESGGTGFGRREGGVAWPGPVISDDVARSLRSALSNLRLDHLLVLKYHCFDELTFKKTAQCVRRVLRTRKFSRTTADVRYREALSLLRRVPKAGGQKEVRARASRYENPFLPANEEEETAFRELFCDILHERLARIGYSRELLDEIGARVEKAHV